MYSAYTVNKNDDDALKYSLNFNYIGSLKPTLECNFENMLD